MLGAFLSSMVATGSSDSSLRVVAFGDSTTVGYSVSDSYPQKIARRLFERGISATVINSGVNGDTTAGGRERFERDVLAHSPDIVIIQFGLNDQTVRLYQKPEEVKSYLTEDQFCANLRYFISELRQRRIQVVLMTPNPMCWTPTLERHYPDGPFLKGPRASNSLLERYVASERKLAESEHIPLLDVFDKYLQFEKSCGLSMQQLFLEDGVHPSEAGNDLNVTLLWKELLPLVMTDKRCPPQQTARDFYAIRDGKPIAAYVAGRSCRARDGYFELSQTEQDSTPRACLCTPVALGKKEWELRLEITSLVNSEWSIQLGDTGQIVFSTVSGRVTAEGGMFEDSAKERFIPDQVCKPRVMSLVLARDGHRLRMRIDGHDVGAAGIAPSDQGSVQIIPRVGIVQIRNFQVL